MLFLLRTLLTAALLGLLLPAAAQDAFFSQFFASPQTLNPALTGLFPGRYRVALSHRSQWGQVMPTPYQTSAFAADFRYALDSRRRSGSDAFGGGVYFLNDRVAEVSYGATQAMLGFAFHKALDRRGEQLLSIGVQGGILQRTLGYGELSFQDEFNGVDGFALNTTGEALPENTFARGDYQLGINFSYDPRRRRATGLFFGAAVHHLTAPEHSFYTDLPNLPQGVEVTNRLHRRYSGYANLRFPVGPPGTFLSPRLVATVQGPHAMVNGGLDLRLPLDPSEATALHLGGWVRGVRAREATGWNGGSMIGQVGLEASGFLVGLSYDASLGWQGVAERHRGAFELSLTYRGRSEEDEAVPCPTF